MRFANSGRLSALLIAAGLMLWVSTPSHAQDATTNDAGVAERTADAQPGKPVALNKFTKRKRSAKVARVQKPRVIAKGYRRKAIEADAPTNVVPINDSDPAALPLPDAVSNANAQWPSPDTSIQPVTAMPATTQPVSSDVVATDQLNEMDKNATPTGDDAASQIASKMTTQIVQNPSQAAGVNVPTTATPAMSAMASADKPQVASDDDSAWGQSSLIGKIFIAFGGLLTVASAARMFMA